MTDRATTSSEVCDQRNREVWGSFLKAASGFGELLLIRLFKALGKL